MKVVTAVTLARKGQVAHVAELPRGHALVVLRGPSALNPSGARIDFSCHAQAMRVARQWVAREPYSSAG